jgi:hypothetical protein
VPRTTGLLIVSDKCIRPAEEAEWHAWYSFELLPALQADGGPWVSTRFGLTERPQPGMPGLGFTHVTVHELDADDPIAQALATVDRLRAAPRHAGHATIAADVLMAHGPWSDKPPPDDDLRGHILANVLCTDPTREAQWDAWYDDTHVPDMLSCGAFGAMTRWRRVPRPALGPAHVTLYDVSTATVIEAVERSAATLVELTAAGRKLDVHTGGLTLLLERTGAPPTLRP